MNFRPGSFTKNYGWNSEHKGLLKLKTDIQQCFPANKTKCSRTDWLARSIAAKDPALVPLNFFLLNNDQDELIKDELIHQALTGPETDPRYFSCLAWFSLVLSNIGVGHGNNPSRPLLWANRFIREKLWKDGVWQYSNTSPLANQIQSFIGPHFTATPESVRKVANNFAYIFVAAFGFGVKTQEGRNFINSHSHLWTKSAILLTWDRFFPKNSWSNNNVTQESLLSCLKTEEIHKLTGTLELEISEMAKEVAHWYIEAGGIRRFDNPDFPEKLISISAATGVDAAVRRALTKTNRIIRDPQIVAELKGIYANDCVICKEPLQIGVEKFYCEGAHIKPLGNPYNGPDIIGNLLPLCPNHHLQFDEYYLTIKADSAANEYDAYYLNSEGNPEFFQPVEIKHSVSPSLIDWHYDWTTSGGEILT